MDGADAQERAERLVAAWENSDSEYDADLPRGARIEIRLLAKYRGGVLSPAEKRASGGVGCVVTLPHFAHTAEIVQLTGRFGPGWKRSQLVSRIAYLLLTTDAMIVLNQWRDLLYRRMEYERLSDPGFDLAMMKHAIADQLPPYFDEMDEQAVQQWLLWLDTRALLAPDAGL